MAVVTGGRLTPDEARQVAEMIRDLTARMDGLAGRVGELKSGRDELPRRGGPLNVRTAD